MKARNLPPALIRDYKLVKLQPVTRLLFISLQCMADRAGILEDDHEQIAFDCGLMGFDCRIEIDKLVNAGILSRHKSDKGKSLLKIVEWDKYQRPHHTEGKSKFVIAVDYVTEEKMQAASNNNAIIANNQTDAGRICRLLREQCKMSGVSPSHPKLIEAIGLGATDEAFIDAGHDAVANGKSFGYVLGTVIGRLRDAAAAANGVGATSAKNVPKARKTEAQKKWEEDCAAREAAGVPVSPF